MSDATVLIRDIAGDAASKAADKVNPSEDELKQIDEPEKPNTWHETPSADGLKQQVKQAVPFSKKDVDDVVGDASQGAHPSGSRDPADVADRGAQDAQTGGQSVDPKAGAQNAKDTIAKKVDANVDDETKENAKETAAEYRERTKNYFKGKFPKDRREQTVFRLKKMIVEIQGHSDCEYSW